MTKTPAKFQKDPRTTVRGVAYTKYPPSIAFELEELPSSKRRKIKTKIISGTYQKQMYIFRL